MDGCGILLDSARRNCREQGGVALPVGEAETDHRFVRWFFFRRLRRRIMQSRNWVFLALLVFPMLGGANDFSGRFHAATEDGVAALDLEQTSSNRYQGTS